MQKKIPSNNGIIMRVPILYWQNFPESTCAFQLLAKLRLFEAGDKVLLEFQDCMGSCIFLVWAFCGDEKGWST